MAHVEIVAGRAPEVLSDERREATVRLADELRAAGMTVEVEFVERVPGRYGLTLVEWTSIYVVGPVTATLLAKITNDVYEAARRSLRRRRQARLEKEGRAGRQLGFVIYGPDGTVLRRWDTREDGDRPESDDEK